MEKEKYYYIRDDKKQPIVTICLLKRKNQISRGIAICSNKDRSCKKIGRAIAKERASFAMSFKANGLKINRSDIDIFLSAFSLGFYKSYYNPKLTEIEQRLFHANDKKQNEEGEEGERYE